ncbi:hypothetical protein [Bosea sp. LjRoot237]|uniref:hypothetical protein n=1 Tax=Bosea sp. LjRoot237 TaxID=3342292 RepID=UPI003ECE94C6
MLPHRRGKRAGGVGTRGEDATREFSIIDGPSQLQRTDQGREDGNGSAFPIRQMRIELSGQLPRQG